MIFNVSLDMRKDISYGMVCKVSHSSPTPESVMSMAVSASMVGFEYFIDLCLFVYLNNNSSYLVP